MRLKSILTELECKYCCAKMMLDDINFTFKGNQEEYWYCTCGASCIVKVRYNRPIKYNYSKPDY